MAEVRPVVGMSGFVEPHLPVINATVIAFALMSYQHTIAIFFHIPELQFVQICGTLAERFRQSPY